LQLIETAETLCRRIGRAAILIRLGFMRCIARLAAGKQQTALSEASELLARAAQLGTVRALADLGALAHPLAKLLVSRGHGETEHEMLQIALRSGYADSTDPVAPLTEPLTAREQDVLELLGKGLSAKSIGRSLDISLATAKWHLKNVYGKLHAGSREDVLAKARRHRIIS
jgi:LuxR family maltose regulon positive regulatory protein